MYVIPLCSSLRSTLPLSNADSVRIVSYVRYFDTNSSHSSERKDRWLDLIQSILDRIIRIRFGTLQSFTQSLKPATLYPRETWGRGRAGIRLSPSPKPGLEPA